VLEKLRGLLVGGPKNLLDPRIHHHLALIAFFAWVGLGSDGLSSSCYGPEEVFRQLGEHRHLALYLPIRVWERRRTADAPHAPRTTEMRIREAARRLQLCPPIPARRRPTPTESLEVDRRRPQGR